MLAENRKRAKKIGVYILAAALLILQILFHSSAFAEEGGGWRRFYAKGGECAIAFPEPPTLVQQSLALPNASQRLHYDLYLAPFENKGIFLLLIATYPIPLSGGHEIAGLEGLLKGIVGRSPDQELVFAELLHAFGHPALNFLVQSPAGYFRGRALMVGNKLFLLAMEGKKSSVDEEMFNRFLDSFKLL